MHLECLLLLIQQSPYSLVIFLGLTALLIQNFIYLLYFKGGGGGGHV